jgi:hypothetical protein
VISVQIWVPGPVSNPKNLSGLGLWKHRRMIRAARERAHQYMLHTQLTQPTRRWPWPADVVKRVHFHAILPRLLDDDSLPFALSPYRDALGDMALIGRTAGTLRGPGRVKDAPGDGHVFTYDQRRALPDEAVGVLITVTPA